MEREPNMWLALIVIAIIWVCGTVIRWLGLSSLALEKKEIPPSLVETIKAQWKFIRKLRLK